MPAEAVDLVARCPDDAIRAALRAVSERMEVLERVVRQGAWGDAAALDAAFEVAVRELSALIDRTQGKLSDSVIDETVMELASCRHRHDALTDMLAKACDGRALEVKAVRDGRRCVARYLEHDGA